MDQNTLLNKIGMQIVQDGRSRIIPLNSKKYCLYAPFSFYENVLELQTPYSFERTQDIEKITNMVSFLEDEYKNKKEIPDLDMIHLASLGNHLYIIDGVHRYTSISTFFTNYKRQRDNYYILSTIYIVDSQVEIKNIVNRINTNHEKDSYLVLNEEDENTDEEKMEYIERKIKEKYSKYVSANENCRSPRFHMKLLLDYVSDKFRKMNGIKIMEEIEKLNNSFGEEYRQHDVPFYREANDVIKENENMSPFYLSKELNGYRIMKNTEEREGRVKILSYQRRSLWNKYFEDETNIGRCAYCSCQLKMSQMHIGHIQSVQSSREGAGNGPTGVNSIDNMTILCSACNTSLGSKNVYDAIIEDNITNSFIYMDAKRYYDEKRREEEERMKIQRSDENKVRRMKKRKDEGKEGEESKEES